MCKKNIHPLNFRHILSPLSANVVASYGKQLQLAAFFQLSVFKVMLMLHPHNFTVLSFTIILAPEHLITVAVSQKKKIL